MASFIRGLFIWCLVLLCAGNARSDPLPPPTGDILLAVTGAIGVTNAEGRALFDLEMLSALPVSEFRTTTIWTQGRHVFTGVSLAELLRVVEARGTILRAIAINDYVVEFPIEDAMASDAIVAYLIDGRPMPVREKGPLWIVHPFDRSRAYRTETVYARSIWQLNRIEVLP